MNLHRMVWRVTSAAAMFAAVAPAVFAQRTTFNPSITFGYFNAEDVDLVGAADQSDVGFRIATELPVEHQLAKGSIEFRYRPQFEQFNEFSELDNTAHKATLDLSLAPTRLSSFSMRMSYDRGLDQGRAGSERDSDLFLTRRTDRQLAGIEVDYSNRLKGGWDWRGSVGFSASQFDEIQGFDSGGPSAGVEDRTETEGSFGISRRLARTTSIGARFERREFDLEESGEELAELVSLVVRRELSSRSSLNLAVGAFRSSGTAARGANSDPNDRREGLQGSLALKHSRRHVDLAVFARSGPTDGGASAGTSSNSLIGLSVSGRPSPRLSWSSAIRYARREPSDAGLETLESVSVTLGTEIRVLRFIGLRLGVNYVDQSEGTDELKLFSDGGISLVWYPLAGRRISGQSRESVTQGQGRQP